MLRSTPPTLRLFFKLVDNYLQFERIENRYLAYIVVTKLCYVKIKWQSKRVLSVTLFIFLSIFYFNILYQYYINMYIIKHEL